MRDGVSSDERARIKDLEREVKELRKANEIVKLASAFFALQEMYGAEVSPSLISSVTDAVMDEAKAWQVRPLDALYPIVYLDCIHVKTRDSGVVRNKAVYLALGVNMAGEKEILGLWIAQTEGAKFWLQVVTELKNRGVADIFIACVIV